jgi:hypothetical protein
MAVWRRTKAKVSRLLGNAPPKISNPPDNTSPKIHTAHEWTFRLPYDIVEMVVAGFSYDLHTLKTCSLTCRSWYIVAAQYLHHTLTLSDKRRFPVSGGLAPLLKLHELGLLPLVKEIRARRGAEPNNWFQPQDFSPCDLRCFAALTNVHTLELRGLNTRSFVPGIEHYFQQFSQTLRSISLHYPACSAQQLSHFLSLFPNLDDINMWETRPPHVSAPDTELVPFFAPKLRGQLKLHHSDSIEIWTSLIALCGGLRFRHMDLCQVANCGPILFEACAETLETLRFSVPDSSC